ncbi:MAG: sporulation transcriptional regulator SpoIIID [Ruminococcus sp.]|nr:sporulation transcriptional regulator SpoIIID [Ruminococcus sp.]
MHTQKNQYKNPFPFCAPIHKDVSERLKTENPALYSQVKDILEINKRERHIRGGLATKKKYLEISQRKLKSCK